MRFTPWALLLLAGLGAGTSAKDIAGNWDVVFVRGVEWKTIGGAEFEFKVEGNKLAGRAHVGLGYPGTAPISEGTIDGDRISFVVFGRQPSSSGYPTMRFIGTVHGDDIQLTMTLSYSDEHAADAGKSEFEGKRITK